MATITQGPLVLEEIEKSNGITAREIGKRILFFKHILIEKRLIDEILKNLQAQHYIERRQYKCKGGEVTLWGPIGFFDYDDN